MPPEETNEPIFETITATTIEGETHTATSPSDLVTWLCGLPRWTKTTTMAEAKSEYARHAKRWSGREVPTDSAWRFLRGMERAGIITLSFDTEEVKA